MTDIRRRGARQQVVAYQDALATGGRNRLRPVRHEGFESLTGVETCLVVTYRKDGHPVGVGAATICGPTDLIQRCPVSVGYEFEVNLSACL
jgi:hypothetical protein